MTLTDGMPLTGFITLVDKLGEGGMGSVWRAHHKGLGADVAVKLISRDKPEDHPTLVPRFEREAVVTNVLLNPHAVQTIEHGVAKDGSRYIVMELLEGESLDARMKRGEKLTLRETELIVRQVAEVLSEAHEKGITHRDIKPANIFLLPSDDVFVKVLDFGIAKHADSDELGLTANDGFLGSPSYMSPEQITGASGVDGRADLWSLAVVVYEALVGSVPFAGESLGQIMMAVVEREYSTPLSDVEGLPETLEDFFATAFAKELDDRFQRGEQLAEALSAAAAGRAVQPKTALAPGETSSEEPADAAPDSLPPPSIDELPLQRHGWALAVAAAIAVAAATGLLLLTCGATP